MPVNFSSICGKDAPNKVQSSEKTTKAAQTNAKSLVQKLDNIRSGKQAWQDFTIATAKDPTYVLTFKDSGPRPDQSFNSRQELRLSIKEFYACGIVDVTFNRQVSVCDSQGLSSTIVAFSTTDKIWNSSRLTSYEQLGSQ